ncbi:MAG: cysteine--tRNA ligase [Candidatus Pacearchaeota archaeon]|nr:cysteine--tRNA ligase [Candidatus Pacearchaeota archaeon]
MPIKLYNTLNRKEEIFVPLKKGQVGIYSCGPTVYWYQHIGNLRTYVSNDLIKRVFLYNKYKVKHITNITDVGHLTSDADTGEDKMERAAKKEGKKAEDVANYYFSVFKKDLENLNIIFPNAWPKATEHIKEMIELIKILEKKGFTYKTSDGIYFDTSKLKDYGKLARLDIEKLQAGKRIDLGEKKNTTDFALWKFSPSANSGGRRQQEWDSPWGIGFPGWHIECSVMSSKYLGKQFDIHTGGQEHIPVHHTNEIAQSEAAFGKVPWVRYWIHFAWLLSGGKKVSKSEGGLYTLSELKEKGFNPLSFKYMCLTTHYKKPLNFSLEILQTSQNSYERLKNITSEIKKNRQKTNKKNIENAKKQFLEIINDDFNSPKGLSFLWEILRDERLNNTEKYELAIDFDEVFGLNLENEEKIEIPKEVKKLAKERKEARKKKNWREADEIRNRIKKLGFNINDTEKGSEIKKL